MKFLFPLSCLFCLLILVGCNPEPEPIRFGEDNCAYCKMGIVDPKFGSELVTDKGRVYKFDAIECMVPFIAENGDIEPAILLGIAYNDPKKLYEVDNLYFEISEKYQSPMGANIAAFKRENNSAAIPGNALNWEQLQAELFAN